MCASNSRSHAAENVRVVRLEVVEGRVVHHVAEVGVCLEPIVRQRTVPPDELVTGRACRALTDPSLYLGAVDRRNREVVDVALYDDAAAPCDVDHSGEAGARRQRSETRDPRLYWERQILRLPLRVEQVEQRAARAISSSVNTPASCAVNW
jgi:hypothetical protein